MLWRKALPGRRLYRKIQLALCLAVSLMLLAPGLSVIWMSILAETFWHSHPVSSQTKTTGKLWPV